MTSPQLMAMQFQDDVACLAQLEHDWVWYLIQSAADEDPFVRDDAKIMADKCDALIVRLQARMCRRYL